MADFIYMADFMYMADFSTFAAATFQWSGVQQADEELHSVRRANQHYLQLLAEF